MEATAIRNESGFSLIEVLVAMCILLFGLLGSMTGVMAAVDQNLRSSLREEAVMLAREQIETNRNINYAAVAEGITDTQVSRSVRKAQRTYDVRRTVATVGTLKRVTITVSWTHKTRTNSYSLESILRQAV
jgi:type IV pilus assembly protein PilV